MSFNIGCCGSFIKLILCIINIIFLFAGLAVFILASILRWGSDSIIKEITNNEAVRSIFNISVIDGVSIALLAFGAFIILLSLIGLMGVICNSKCFLYLYEFTIILLFLGHGVSLLVVTLTSDSIEVDFKQAINNTMDNINNATHDITPDKFDDSCAIMKGLSEIFQCCGSTAKSDFIDQSLTLKCCINNTSIGCGIKTVDSIKSNAVNIVFIPSGVILGFELILILMVPILVSRLNKNKSKDEKERLINDTYSEMRNQYKYKK